MFRHACALVALYCILPFALATEIDDGSMVKSFDGKTVYCNQEQDLGRAAYRPSQLALSANGETIGLDLSIEGLLCVKSSGSYGWAPRGFDSAIPYITPEGKPATLILQEQEFVLINDAYQILGTLPVGSRSVQELRYLFELSSILSAPAKRRLDQGEEIRARVEIFQRAIAKVEVEGKSIPLGRVTGGSYYLQFRLQKSPIDGSLQTSRVLLQ